MMLDIPTECANKTVTVSKSLLSTTFSLNWRNFLALNFNDIPVLHQALDFGNWKGLVVLLHKQLFSTIPVVTL